MHIMMRRTQPFPLWSVNDWLSIGAKAWKRYEKWISVKKLYIHIYICYVMIASCNQKLYMPIVQFTSLWINDIYLVCVYSVCTFRVKRNIYSMWWDRGQHVWWNWAEMVIRYAASADALLESTRGGLVNIIIYFR